MYIIIFLLVSPVQINKPVAKFRTVMKALCTNSWATDVGINLGNDLVFLKLING